MGDFKVASGKQGLVLEWMLSRSKDNSAFGQLNHFVLAERRTIRDDASEGAEITQKELLVIL